MLALEVEGASITNPTLFCGSRLAGAAAGTTGRLHRWQASSHKCTHTLRNSAPCGSRLADDGCYAFQQAQRGVCIAGKPAPTSAPTPCATPPLWQPACRRCFRHNEASASLASQLPQVHLHPAPHRLCGSRLAGDGWYAFLQTQPGVCIAGKPAPTSAPTPCATPLLWEPACRRWLLRVPADTTGRLHRWQASFHKQTSIPASPRPALRIHPPMTTTPGPCSRPARPGWPATRSVRSAR